MSKTKKSDHIHKFIRVDYKTGYKAFKCILPNCAFILDVKASIGREVICWSGDHIFILTSKHIKQRRPKCNKCTTRWAGGAKEVDQESIDNLKNMIMGG